MQIHQHNVVFGVGLREVIGENRAVARKAPHPAQVMSTTVLAPAQWAQMEFALARLGDQRRTQRLVKIATRLAQSPGGTLPQAMPRWEELKAAYRFFSQPKITFEEILQPHWERTQEACRQAGEYLLIEDTTLLDYTGGLIEELGIIGDGGQGLSLHSTLALQVRAWDLEQRPETTVVGLFKQQCWSAATSAQGRDSHRAYVAQQPHV
jgi:hypothetical protein